MSNIAQGRDRFADQFKWLATVDQTPYLCVPEAIKFRKDICGGEEKIQQYCFNLAREGGRSIAKTLGTELMENRHRTLGQCCFTNVRLPLGFHGPHVRPANLHDSLDAMDGPEIVKWLMDRAMCEYDTWIPGKFYDGAAWVRLSAQVYLEMKHFEWAATILQKLCNRVVKGEWRQKRAL